MALIPGQSFLQIIKRFKSSGAAGLAKLLMFLKRVKGLMVFKVLLKVFRYLALGPRPYFSMFLNTLQKLGLRPRPFLKFEKFEPFFFGLSSDPNF